MIRKKLAALALGGVITGSLLMPLAACLPIRLPESKPKLPEWEANVTLTSGGAEVSWDGVKGAKEYKVYHSEGRFGTYELVSTQTKCSYTGSDRYGYYQVDALDAAGEVISSELYSYEIDTFGGNTHIYSPADDQQLINADIDAFRESTGQFKEGRFAALFKAGKYNSLDLRMRYYMTYSGLDYFPTGVEIGGFNVYGELSGGNATCNFWCGIDNMTVNSDVQWAVSQATSFRRMKVNGSMTLVDRGSTPWASGGFISDTVVEGNINAGGQQQWFTRNSDWRKWSGCNINMVYSGCKGSFEDGSYVWPYKRVTNLETTNVISEKPYLVFDNGYSVCLPALQKNSSGVSWDKDSVELNENDTYLPLSDFYVARSDRDDAATLNAALKNGKHILLTPGIYQIESPLLVEKADTIVMGLGLATLKLSGENTDTIMRISDADGVRLSGIMFDAGTYSKTLLQIGTEKTSVRHEENPVILNDVYYRIGGAGSQPTSVDTTLEINSNDVIGDNFWVWRADHGNSGTVGWEINKTRNGVIVNGDYVTVYGLMVEHFHEYQTVWNGEHGFMAFYQSETPYDVDDLEQWTSEWNGVKYSGYASYKVSDAVQNHTAYGIGVYYVARGSRTFILDHAIELPSNGGIHVEHMATTNFSGSANGIPRGITHIVNDRGSSAFENSPRQFTSYIAGVYTD